MNNAVKRIDFILLVGIVVAVSFLQLPIALSTDVQVSDAEKAMTFMKQVVELDVEKYSIQVKVINDTDNEMFDNAVKFILSSSESKLEVLSLFRNNKLVWCKLYRIEGDPQFAKTSSKNSLEAAKNVIAKLQDFSVTSYLPTMRNMLDETTDEKSATTVTGNLKQKISIGAGSEDIQWLHNSNGIENSYKAVVLTLQKGNFEFFCDDWDLYTIGNTDMKISQEQAVQIAKKQAIDKYSSSSNQSVRDFTIVDENARITLTMQDRGNFTLYPLWEILLPLDKMIGGATGIRVLIWADTGKVAFVAADGNYGIPPSNQELSGVTSSLSSSSTTVGQTWSLVIGALIAVVIAIAGFLFYKRKK